MHVRYRAGAANDGFVEGQEIKIALGTLSKLKKEVLKFL
jgi:hypothetical protein